MVRLFFCFRATVSLILLVAASAAHANPYQLEGHLGYSESNDNEIDIENRNADLTWWLGPVEYQGKPWHEAGFLERESSARVSYQRSSIERAIFAATVIGAPPAGRFEDTDETAELAIRFFLPGDRWFGELSAGIGENSAEQPGAPDIDGHVYGATIGYYLGSNTSLSLFSDLDEREGSGVLIIDCEALGGLFFCPERTRTNIDSETVRYGVSFKHVGKFLTNWFGVEATYGRIEVDTDASFSITFVPPRLFGIPRQTNTISQDISSDVGPTDFASIELDWYPTHRTRLGVEVGYVEVDLPVGDDSLYSYGLNLEWFAHPSIGVAVGVSRQESPHDLEDDTNTITAGLRFRF